MRRRTKYTLELRYLRTHKKIAAWLLEYLRQARLESSCAEGAVETVRIRVRLTGEEAQCLHNAAEWEGIEAVILTRAWKAQKVFSAAARFSR